MGRIVVTEFVSLDGVVEAPGGGEGFKHGGWSLEIERGRSAQFRPSRLEGAPLKQAAEWLDGYRGFWQDSFERLDERLGTGDDPRRG